MTLREIRDSDLDTLKKAVQDLCLAMESVTYGEFEATKRTIEYRAKELGWSLKDLNDYAAAYQQAKEETL